jgi:DNA-binding transcriptional ArsR family regulator
VLFSAKSWPGLRDGTITVTFRTWKRSQVKVGGTYRPGGVVALLVDAVERVPVSAITPEDAQAAGEADLAALLKRLGSPEPGAEVWRIDFHVVDSPDPRLALRADDRLDDGARADILRRLDRLDRASPHGPWTRATLDAIAAQPGVVSTVLAEQLGRDRPSFKVDVRKLKAMGLTESLEVGYRLSPRGASFLAGSTAGSGSRAGPESGAGDP